MIATNTTRRPRSALIEALGRMGIAIRPEQCLTAPRAAVEYLRASGARRVLPLVSEATRDEFADFVVDWEMPEQVVVGDLGPDWSYEVLNRAFRALMRGARLVAVQRNPFWKTADGLSLDAGAFVAALEYASGQTATLVGKPSPSFFRAAARQLDVAPERIAVVGDDFEADVRGARRAGLLGVAVRTGKFGAGPPELASQADAVLDSIADLPGWLGIDSV